MSRVLLVSCNVTREPYPVYPLGMAVVASALSAAGHEVCQFDFLASDEDEAALRERLDGFSPDYVGLSIRNLDNCDSLDSVSYPAIAGRIAAVVRSACAAPLIVGGPAFSIMPGLLLDLTGADHGVIGEGERIVCGLIDDLENGKSAPRLLKDERLLAGADMPPPLYSQELVDWYVAQSGMVNLQTKRGCPHGCVYCSYPSLEGNGWRCRDPREVADDIERLRTDHGVGHLFFTDSVFNDEAGRFLLVAEEIIRRSLAVRFSCYMRPQGIRRADLALLKRAGLYAAELGTDAACDATLLGLGKGFTFGEALEANRAFAAERIPCAHFVMFGGPGETPGTVAEGLANLDRLEHTVVFAYAGISILPGTALFARAVREGIVSGSEPLRRPVYYISPEVDPDAMSGMISDSFRGRRDRVFPPSEGQRKLEILHRFGYRGLLWDTLIRFPKEAP
ncbi:MAG TPA: lipid biosynthesis B12-binding/radical SAM protein [Candidatus Deferrimicrobiaceae bacterium]